MPRIPAGVRLTPSRAIAQANRVGGTGRVNVRAKFRYNTRFPDQFNKDRGVHELWEAMKDRMVATAQRLVPVVTGQLHDSIEGRVTRSRRNGYLRVELSAGGRGKAPHWAFVEYGTGARGIASPQPEPGRPVGYRSNPKWAGQRAQPYLRPALIELRQNIRTVATYGVASGG